MIKANPTINDVINELMFIAIAKPEKLSVSVRYIGHADALEVIAVDKAYFSGIQTPNTWSAHKLMDKTIYLDGLTAFRQVTSTYNELSNLIKNEVAA
ncbi:hypothetical protein ACPSKX_14640 [Moritella viscosa]|uniref:hypothetical protein n=1 Tax=Moritella viscosa TaxID=80854 RepID=UPI00091B486E|nr:hypothetical protein [Moritella viscosa]SHO02375.1 Putative uncharacterized protein [Moritella viscosa]SHO02528.1 Putative uncharacterized protein [Moritella viscosa]SHO19188.1 Putative uncharacterized protein [Moritella viscosa]